MKKICFLTPGLDAGGIENYLLRFIKYLSDCSNITIIVRNKKKGDLYNEYTKTGVHLHFQEVSYINPIKWFNLYKYFRYSKFFAVCDFTGNFSGIPITLARWSGVKRRITFYRNSSNAFKGSIIRLLYNYAMNRLVYYNATDVLSNSQHALNFFFPHRLEEDLRYKVIPNGINPKYLNISVSKKAARQMFNIPDNAFVVGHIGRYDPSKNHATIFKVAEVLSKSNCNIKFVFCGKGTDSKEFCEQIEKLNLHNVCYCLGLQNNVPLVLKTMDLFYFPSVTEGQPNALIEAMVAGLPILASNIPPIKEIIPESMYTVLIPPLDINNAVKRISYLVENRINLEIMIIKEKAIIKFDMKTNFEKFFDILIN